MREISYCKNDFVEDGGEGSVQPVCEAKFHSERSNAYVEV